MSDTTKKEKHTLHRASKEYIFIKCSAVGRIKHNGASYICPCCVKDTHHKFKVNGRRLLRRKMKHILTVTISQEI